MRHVIADTETTGGSALKGDRIVEIALIEMVDYRLTGRFYHQIINPDRRIHEKVTLIHGISDHTVRDKPEYRDIAGAVAEFIDNGILVAHNAPFDRRFINTEQIRAGYRPYPVEQWIDTLTMAKKLYPKQKNTLDALCERYAIDASQRIKHGALTDTLLLAESFPKLIAAQTESKQNAPHCS